LQKGIDIQKTQIMFYGRGFYVTPHLDTALMYARERFHSRRSHDRGFTPVLMVYWISPDNLQNMTFPDDFNGNLGMPGPTTIFAIKKSVVHYLQPMESIIIENLMT
jgi:hypothetical protein